MILSTIVERGRQEFEWRLLEIEKDKITILERNKF